MWDLYRSIALVEAKSFAPSECNRPFPQKNCALNVTYTTPTGGKMGVTINGQWRNESRLRGKVIVMVNHCVLVGCK